jgi:hypothetical protein
MVATSRQRSRSRPRVSLYQLRLSLYQPRLSLYQPRPSILSTAVSSIRNRHFNSHLPPCLVYQLRLSLSQLRLSSLPTKTRKTISEAKLMSTAGRCVLRLGVVRPLQSSILSVRAVTITASGIVQWRRAGFALVTIFIAQLGRLFNFSWHVTIVGCSLASPISARVPIIQVAALFVDGGPVFR